jgi:hypothetical protein
MNNDIFLESRVTDILIELIEEQVQKDLYENMSTSDLQGYLGVKAKQIIKECKEE